MMALSLVMMKLKESDILKNTQMVGDGMTEADLKRSVEDFLTYAMNQGKLYFDRLNSGEVIVIAGKSRRRIKLCRKGTWDFFVLQDFRIIFLECKVRGRKLTEDQMKFGDLVRRQGAEGFIISDTDYLMQLFPISTEGGKR